MNDIWKPYIVLYPLLLRLIWVSRVESKRSPIAFGGYLMCWWKTESLPLYSIFG